MLKKDVRTCAHTSAPRRTSAAIKQFTHSPARTFLKNFPHLFARTIRFGNSVFFSLLDNNKFAPCVHGKFSNATSKIFRPHCACGFYLISHLAVQRSLTKCLGQEVPIQVILFEIDCAIVYTNLRELFCQFIT